MVKSILDLKKIKEEPVDQLWSRDRFNETTPHVNLLKN
jgi:hypothetical protein